MYGASKISAPSFCFQKDTLMFTLSIFHAIYGKTYKGIIQFDAGLIETITNLKTKKKQHIFVLTQTQFQLMTYTKAVIYHSIVLQMLSLLELILP